MAKSLLLFLLRPSLCRNRGGEDSLYSDRDILIHSENGADDVAEIEREDDDVAPPYWLETQNVVMTWTTETYMYRER